LHAIPIRRHAAVSFDGISAPPSATSSRPAPRNVTSVALRGGLPLAAAANRLAALCAAAANPTKGL